MDLKICLVLQKIVVSKLETLYILQSHNVEITETFFFGKNFVKVMVLLTKLLNSWFDEKKNGESTFFIFPQCALSLFWQKFRESNVFTSKRSYCVANFTKYFYGEWERICVFSVFYEFSREINLYKVKLLYLISRIFP